MQAALSRRRSTVTRPRLPFHLPATIVRTIVLALALWPISMRLEWLERLRASMGAMHPCVDEVVTEIAELRAARRVGVRAAWRTFLGHLARDPQGRC